MTESYHWVVLGCSVALIVISLFYASPGRSSNFYFEETFRSFTLFSVVGWLVYSCLPDKVDGSIPSEPLILASGIAAGRLWGILDQLGFPGRSRRGHV